MIIIEPHSGLANRMRSIASALWLAEQTRQELLLIWNEDNDLNAPFESLFQPIDNIQIVSKKWRYHHVKASLQESRIKRRVASFINGIIGMDVVIKDQDFRKYFWNDRIDPVALINKHENTYIHSCEEIGDKSGSLGFFRPAIELEEVINAQLLSFDEHIIGIHIRRTDHDWSIKNSPTWLYVDIMNKELSTNPDIRFFLATDDPDTEEELITEFGDRIISYAREKSRNTSQGMKDAIVDMYCLAATRKIYGSYWSSFSRIASRIQNTPLEVLQIQ